MASPVYSSYIGCPHEIKTHVNTLEKNKKIIQETGQNSVGCQGATSLQSLEALYCVASETQARGEVVICQWRRAYCVISFMSCGWRADHPPREHWFEIKAIHLGVHRRTNGNIINDTNLKGRNNSGGKYSVIWQLPTWCKKRRNLIRTTIK